MYSHLETFDDDNDMLWLRTKWIWCCLLVCGWKHAHSFRRRVGLGGGGLQADKNSCWTIFCLLVGIFLVLWTFKRCMDYLDGVQCQRMVNLIVSVSRFLIDRSQVQPWQWHPDAMSYCHAVDSKWSWLALSSYPFMTTMGTRLARTGSCHSIGYLDTIWIFEQTSTTEVMQRCKLASNMRLGSFRPSESNQDLASKTYVKIWISTGICGLDFRGLTSVPNSTGACRSIRKSRLYI